MKRFTRIMTLIGALVLSIGMVAAQGGFNDKSPEANTNPVTSEALFDLQFQYPCGVGGGEAGIECDGSFFYTTKWNGTDVFYKYQLDGTYLNEFTVPGTGGIRDLAFDGTYMYGSEATNTVREMDFTGGTLISSFSAPTAVRAIAWNEDDQVFYANNWSTNIIPFNKSGVQQRTSWTPGPIGASYYGFAYDNYSSGAPYLWGYAQTGSTNNELVQMQLPGGAETGVYFDVGSIIPPTTGIAGGLCIDNAFVSGYYTLAGNMQNDFLWGLELCEDGGGPGALYFNDFEAYNVGDFLAVVDPTHWTTWSGAPGGPEDAPIVDDQAYSGTKSVQVTGATTDAVFLINDLTSGHYTIHFMTYVVSGNNGYFNVLQDFNGTSSLWGIEVFFDAAGVGTVNAGGTGTATFSYSYDTWFLSELKVNLDTDWAQLFIDGNLVIEYVWSTGATGTQTLNALGGVDMYAWTVNGPCNYYFDDFTFDEVGGVTLDPPTDLEADVTGNDVHLTWVAPGGGGTIEELIYDNGTNTGAYSYQGYTMSTQMSPSGPCQVLKMKFWTSIQAGDNTFNATLFEWAGSQPSTTIDYEELVTAADDDWMEVDISAQNITYSGDFVVGFGSINATTFLGYDANLNNGRSWDFNNGSPSWAPWNEAYLERAIVQYADGTIAEIGGGLAEPIILKGSVPQLSHPTDYSGVETVKPIGNLSDGLLGYNVYRDGNKINASMVTALEYDDMDLPVGYYEYYVTAVYDEGESGPSNKVYVDIITGIEQPGVINTVIFPNPAREMIHITSATEMSAVRIYNYAGQLVLDTRATGTTCRIDASVLTGGIYIIQVENGDGIHTERIIIE